jgi:hypothetical protein
VKLQRILQKISQSFSGSEHFCRSVTTRRHKSNHLTPKGEKPSSAQYTSDGLQHGLQHSNLDFPLMDAIGIAGRERGTCTHTDIKSIKLERLRLARLIRRDPKATKLDMQMI